MSEVRRIYAEFFATLDETNWDRPVKGGSKEWTLHETIAHLCALNGAGLESIKHTLRQEEFILTFIAGILPNGKQFGSTMSSDTFREMTDMELTALWLYFTRGNP